MRMSRGRAPLTHAPKIPNCASTQLANVILVLDHIILPATSHPQFLDHPSHTLLHDIRTFPGLSHTSHTQPQETCLSQIPILAQRRPTRMQKHSCCLGKGLTCTRYKAKNQEEPGTEEKIQDLASFISRSKFGMMTTTSQGSGRLASRCMALAASVSQEFRRSWVHADMPRKTEASTSSSTQIPSPGRPTILRPTPLSTCPFTMLPENGLLYLVTLLS